MKDKTAIEQMIKELENQVKQSKHDMADARQYGVNSAGFNAYMGRMEMAEQMLEEARRLAAEDAKPTPPKEATAGLEEAIKIMEYARNHGGPVAYADAEDSVGNYVCCGNCSYEDHAKDCWYRKMCEFLDRPHPANPSEGLVECPCDKCHEVKSCKSQCREYYEFEEIISCHTGGKGDNK